MKSPYRRVVAMSSASQVSFMLGTQNWTITGDNPACSLDGAPYNMEMKLTGCGPNKFTCSTGKCIDIEQRCNQIEDSTGLVNDNSDENDCRNIVFKSGYNKEIPPISTLGLELNRKKVPVEVKLSMRLQKVVSIEEEDHSISLKFQISLE